MNTFLAILKNDYRRTVSRMAGTIVITVIMLAMILLAVYITGLQKIQGHVAYVADTAATEIPAHSPLLDVTLVHEKPPRSSLYKQEYDAFVTTESDGTISIESLRNEDFKKMIESSFSSQLQDQTVPSPERKTGVNIIGFLLMFLMMQAFSNMFVFADDKEQGQLVRIAATPASFTAYLAAHLVYSLSLIAPSWLILILLDCCGISIGFSIGEYGLLILVIGFSAISFALLLNTLIKKPDNANMLGNALIMISSLVSGTFYAAPPEHSFFNGMVRLLPQKAVMDFSRALSAGTAADHTGYVAYVIILALIMLTFSYVKLTQRKLNRI